MFIVRVTHYQIASGRKYEPFYEYIGPFDHEYQAEEWVNKWVPNEITRIIELMRPAI